MKIVAVFLLAIAVVWSGDPITKGDKDPIVSAGCTIKNTGHNGQAWPSYKASPAKCVADCKKNPLCVATTSSLAGDCWLLHTYEGSRLYTKVGYLLFRKNCKGNGGCTVRDYGHNGSALTHYKASNAKCTADCIKEPKCVATTHSTANDCWLLHSYLGNIYKKTGYTIFKKNCNQGNGGCTIANAGHNGYEFTHFKTTKQKCTEACIKHPLCVATTHSSHNDCWLLNNYHGNRIYNAAGYTLYKKYCKGTGCTVRGKGHNGSSFKHYKASNAQCTRDCKKNPMCVATTHSSNNDCFLLHSYFGSNVYTKAGYTLFKKICRGYVPGNVGGY